MKRIKYVGSMARAVLFDGREVARGEAFDVEDGAAHGLLAQPDNYAAAEDGRALGRGKARGEATPTE